MPRESIAEGDELVAGGRCGRLGHGDLLGVVTGGRVQTASLPTKEVASHPPIRAAQVERRPRVTLSLCHPGLTLLVRGDIRLVRSLKSAAPH